MEEQSIYLSYKYCEVHLWSRILNIPLEDDAYFGSPFFESDFILFFLNGMPYELWSYIK